MRYKAFISYSHAEDAAVASALEDGLRRFATPWHRKRTLRVFRDKSMLALTHALWPSIEAGLAESDFFLLLASPQAGASEWVSREVAWWLQHRSTETLFIVLTTGHLHWSADARRFEPSGPPTLPAALHTAFAEQPLWLDLRWAKGADRLTLAHAPFRQAVADIAAPLLGVPKDDLIGEDLRQYRRNRAWAWSGAVSLAALAAVAVAMAVVAQLQKRAADEQRREAERQRGIAVEQKEVADAKSLEAAAQRARAEREAEIALARQLIAQSEVARTSGAADRQLSALLAAEGLKRLDVLDIRSFEADAAVRRALALLPQQVATLRTDWPVDAVAFEGGGRRITSASRARAVAIWDRRTHRRLSNTRAPGNMLQSVALSPGGRLLAAGTDAGLVSVHDAATLERMSDSFNLGEDQHTRVVAASGNGTFVAYGGRDVPNGVLLVRNVANGDTLGSVPWSTEVAFSPSSRYLAAGGGLWEITPRGGAHRLEPTAVLQQTAFSVHSVAFSPDERLFARVLSDEGQRRVELWSLQDFRLLQTHRVDVDVRGLAVSSGGRYLALAASFDVEVRELSTGESAVIQHAPTGAVAFSPVEPVLAIGEADGLSLWIISSFAEVSRLAPPRDLHGVAFSRNADRFATLSRVPLRGGTQTVTQTWDVQTGRLASSHGEPGALSPHAFSADGTFAVLAAPAGGVIVRDLATSARRYRAASDGPATRQVALSADGHHVAVLTSNRVVVRDVDSGAIVTSLDCHPSVNELVYEGTPPQIVLGERGWYVAVAFRRRIGPTSGRERPPYVRVWNLRTRAEAFTAPLSEPVFGGPSTPMVFSADGRYLAIGRNDGRVRVFDVALGTDSPSEFAHGLVAFSGDGRYLLTSGTDVESRTGRVYSSADLRAFSTSVAADVAHVWNVATQEEVASVRSEPGSRPLGLSYSGDDLAVLGADASVRIVPLEPRALLAEACRRLTRNLGAAEWTRFLGDRRQEATCPGL